MKVKLVVKSHVTINLRKLKSTRNGKECIKNLKENFRHHNPQFHKLRKMGYPTWSEPSIIKSFEIVNKKKMVFTRGCLFQIKRILKRHDIEPVIVDKTFSSKRVKFNSKIKLRKDQKPCVRKILMKKQGKILAPCSYGKTVVILEAIAQAEQCAMVVVWNTDHQKQWIEEATNKKLLNLDRKDIGGIGGVFKKPKLGKLNICMQQSLNNKNNIKFFVDHIGFLAADEGQRFGAKTFNASINPFPSEYRVTVSADTERSDGKSFLIDDTFGGVIHRAKDSGIGSRIASRISLIVTEFKSNLYEEKKFTPDLLYRLARNKKRNKIILSRCRAKADNKKIVLILVERKHQALYLRQHLVDDYRVHMMIGKRGSKNAIAKEKWKNSWKKFMLTYDSDKSFYDIRRLGAKRKLDIVIATAKGDVGLSNRTFDHVIVTTPTKVKRFNQQKGRGERTHDKEQVKKFGKKVTPTTDYMWDIRGDILRTKGEQIRKNFADVKVINPYKKRKVRNG